MFPITSGITRNKLLADMTDIRPVTINTKSNNTSHLSILSGRYSETSHSPVNFN